MSVSALASLRPLTGQCMRQSRIGVLSVTIKSRSASLNIRAVVELPPLQRRLYSDQKHDDARRQDGRTPTPMPRLTFRQFLGRALAVTSRNIRYYPKRIGKFFNGSPIAFTALIVLTAITITFFVNQLYMYYKLFYNPEMSRFPEPVATSLRRAIYYTTVVPEAERALKYYRRAMAQAHQIGMDPMSDEVLGIRIMVAFWIEKQLNWGQSIQVLESVREDCLKAVEEFERDVKDSKIGEDGRLKAEFAKTAPPSPVPAEGNTEVEPTPAWKPEKDNETLWARRERLLHKAVSTSVKLGEIYASEHVLDPDASHRHLVWAVETTLKESRRRRVEKPNPGEEEWMTPTEMGASMESLGRDYLRRDQFHLSIPLFFQALRSCESPCHRAVIMNNLAASFAQHPIYSPKDGGDAATLSLKEVFDSSMPNTRKDCLEAAANWAKNAYQHAKDVKGDDKTPECDEACAVALCNWGDVALLQGKMELARKKYTQGVDLSNKLEFKDGVRHAQEGLKRLNAAKKT